MNAVGTRRKHAGRYIKLDEGFAHPWATVIVKASFGVSFVKVNYGEVL